MEENRNRSRIGFMWGTILTLLAAVADLIGLIPFMENLSGTIFWIVAGFILWLRGCGLLNWKRLVTSGLSLAAGWVPALQALPQLTAGIIAVIILVVLEDKTGIPLTPGKKLGVRAPLKIPPLNVGGIRRPVKPDL